MQCRYYSISLNCQKSPEKYFQLDSSDEQAAAIRRELDARREKVSEMERVRHYIHILLYSTKILPESKADAEVRAEGHGGTLYRGDEYFYQHSEREPGVTAGTAGRKE